MICNVSDRTRSDLCHNGEGTGDKDATGFLCNSLGTIYEPVSSLSAKNSLTTTCLRGAVLGVGYVLFTNTHYCSVLTTYVMSLPQTYDGSIRRLELTLISVNIATFFRLCRTSDFFFNFNEFQIIQGNYYMSHPTGSLNS